MTASYYESLGQEAHRPDILLRNTFFGLKDYYDYLKLAGENADKTRLRLAWEVRDQPERREGAEGGGWVQLTDPEVGAKVGDQTCLSDLLRWFGPARQEAGARSPRPVMTRRYRRRWHPRGLQCPRT